ncbi:MAG: ATP-dependent DNA helicase RecG [Candidatus Solincola sediminis]|uniref:ATP-dependent DNA helicase RecG n=1 Tax=Candidatus Solincola sediminis TaxID=1797199 RepID=A0A1F2WFY6_9ACTN|nr:MAG: ATP-dependent DNA helicase RecG [Candidatus Solincola sediminis]
MLDAGVGEIKGVGKTFLHYLQSMGINTIEDLLYHFPRRYLDRRKLSRIGDIKIGEDATVVGTVRSTDLNRISRNRTITSVAIYDGSAYLYGTWFNQPYHLDRLQPGTEVVFSGKVQFRLGRLQMINPAYDILEDQTEVGRKTLHTGRIIPLHPASQKLSAAMLRRVIMRCLEHCGEIPDHLPMDIRLIRGYPSRTQALREMHFPGSLGRLNRARQRMAYDELLVMQVALALRRRHFRMTTTGIAHEQPGSLIRSFKKALPFALTKAQERAFSEIASDMSLSYPMNRLMQGEVGSGKTVVALLALLLSKESGHQGALMAPTEVLAEQHFRNLTNLLPGALDLRVEILTGNTPAARRKEILEAARSGELDIMLGTHALIQEDVEFKSLSLIVVDEQQRFGLRQRMLLKEKGDYPDTLIMTATPIPRTLSLTLYGDLEVSAIDEIPSGRAGTATIAAGPEGRHSAYDRIRSELEAGRQAFVVCPLVDASPAVEAKAAEKEAKDLKKVFPEFTIGLLHGQMAKSEKDEVMEGFRECTVQLLVSTTVIEVGIDIPNATVMMVENADRFGLSQLHQLRGRVGRGEYKSHAIFIFDGESEESKSRMRAISRIEDGFELAEADLQIRGEGSLFGTRQSGMPDLRVARLIKDFNLLLKARADAFEIVEKDPGLEDPRHCLLRFEVGRRFGESLDWLFHA